MWRSEESGSIYFCKRTSFYRCCGKSRRLYQKADKLSVNLAEVVKDGTQLTIEKKRKRKAAQEEQSSHGMSSADEAGKINLNTASAEQLMKLSGIGESKAAQIISYREKNGAFKKIEDIMNITGIKEGVFGKIKDDITV